MQQNEQSIYRSLVSLIGHTIEVGRHSAPGKILVGKVANAMFDSFILDISGINQVVPFTDISFLTPKNG